MNPEELLAAHPYVAVDAGMFGGEPHVKGVRLSVGDVLAQLYLLESVGVVAAYYEIGKERVKDAIAFAQDYIEATL